MNIFRLIKFQYYTKYTLWVLGKDFNDRVNEDYSPKHGLVDLDRCWEAYTDLVNIYMDYHIEPNFDPGKFTKQLRKAQELIKNKKNEDKVALISNKLYKDFKKAINQSYHSAHWADRYDLV